VFESEDDSALSFVLDALATFEVGCDDCHGGSEVGESGVSVKRGRLSVTLLLLFFDRMNQLEFFNFSLTRVQGIDRERPFLI
jgi:hypothetical protein